MHSISKKRKLNPPRATRNMGSNLANGLLSGLTQATSTPTVTGQSSSVQRVFCIPELLEAILEVVPPLELFKLQLVNHEFHNNIMGSRSLQDLRLEAALKPLPPFTPEGETIYDSLDHLLHTSFSPLAERLRRQHFVLGPFSFVMLANGGGKQANGNKQVPELQFVLDYSCRIKLSPDGSARSETPSDKLGLQIWKTHAKARANHKSGQFIGYMGKNKLHPPDQTWSCMNMTTDRKPFDIAVWVFADSGDFYKHVVRFGTGRRTMRDLFDILTDVLDRSMERHENEAQIATWNGKF